MRPVSLALETLRQRVDRLSRARRRAPDPPLTPPGLGTIPLHIHHTEFTNPTRFVIHGIDDGRERVLLADAIEAAWGSAGLIAVVRGPRAAIREQLEVIDPLQPGRPRDVARSNLRFVGWSADGRSLAYAREVSDDMSVFFVYDSVRGQSASVGRWRAQLPEDGRLSPDGKLLALPIDTNGDYESDELVMLASDGRTQARLRRQRELEEITWSHDGDRLAFDAGDGIYVLQRDGKGLRRLTTGGDRCVLGWSPGPVNARAPGATPLPPGERVEREALQTRGRIVEIAADARWNAAVVLSDKLDCEHILAWRAGTTRTVRFSNRSPCFVRSDESLFAVHVDGVRISWWEYGCGQSGCSIAQVAAQVQRPGIASHIGDEKFVNKPPKRPTPKSETRAGITFSFSRGTVTLRRQARTLHVSAPNAVVDAELENDGLFYAYNVPSSEYPGRLVFVSRAQLL